MVGRAGPLLAKRSLSALIVAAFVMSSLAGFSLMDNSVHSEAQPIGDLIVTDGTYVIENLDQLVDGDVQVSSDGVLVIRDGSLSVISNYDQRHSVTIGAGGTLILDHGTLTTYLNQINPWAELDLLIQDGGQLIATNQSELRFPGMMTLMNGAEVTLRDSTITCLDGALVSQYVVGSSGLITGDSANDGPEILIMDSTLNMFDSSIDSLPEYPVDGDVAGNLTLDGESTLLAVNSYIDVDFGPALTATQWYVHNVLVINGESHVYLYGTSFDNYYGTLADRAPAVVASGVSTSPAVALTKGLADNTGQSILDLALIDSNTYEVEAQETMELDTWDNGSTDGGLSVASATIMATYSVAANYDGDRAIEWATDGGAYSSTSIVPSVTDSPGTVATYELPITSFATVNDLCDMDLRFVNNGGVGTGSIQIDQIWLMFTVGGDAYIFRWLNATIGDEYGVPIGGASIDATFTGSTEFEGQAAFYYTSDGISTSPDPLVLDYIGETELTFTVTKDDGSVRIPYMTDMILSDGSSNSLFVGSYAFTGSTVIETVVYGSTESLSVEAYPSMTAASQNSELTVEILGISASSPDYTRWLVVPVDESTPTFTIENISYYHAGDVIVASDGELIVRNAEFLLVQETANERTIYVDGNGILTFDNAVFTSALPVEIVVQGSGILNLLNSEMHGVDVVAKENAHVVLDGSTMDGVISTSWDSEAVIDVSDSTLTETPVLSGNSQGSFTNVSIPSIEVEDDAVAYIYRWIHVTVFDGNSKPLPNALVTARFYYPPEEVWTSKVSDSAGIARLPCLGTILTSSGPTFVGNYKVNATLWGGATAYESDQEVSVGVKPYVEPLGTNATYTWLTISSALPDLTIAAEGAVTSDPVNPMNGEVTQIIAQVENIGVAVAYNVPVYFSEDGVVFESIICPRIDPGTMVEVIAEWVAGEPLSPDYHTIRVEVDPYNAILEQDDAAAVGFGYVTVLNLPDLEVDVYGGMFSVPDDIVVDTACELGITILNVGDNDAFSVNVSFYLGPMELVSPATLISWAVVSTIRAGDGLDVMGAWTPATVGTFLVSVVVDGADDIFEIDETNNDGTFTVTVYDHPDLELQDLTYSTESMTTTIAGGDTVTVSARLVNLEPAPVLNPEVRMYLNSTSGDYYDSQIVVGEFREDGLSSWVSFDYTAPFVTETMDVTVYLIVNPDHIVIEQDYDNNEVSIELEITDVRPDLIVTSDDIVVTRAGAEIDSAMFGWNITITVNVTNSGARGVEDFSVSVHIVSNLLNYTIRNVTESVDAGGSVDVTTYWIVSLVSTGDFTMYVSVDPDGEVVEQSEDNNNASRDFTIAPLDITVSVAPTKNEYETGASLNVLVTVRYSGTEIPVVGYPAVVIALFDPDGNELTATRTAVLTTNSVGQISGDVMTVPTGLESGRYTVRVIIQDEVYPSSPITITGDVSGGGIPLMVWLIVIIAIIAVVGAFTLYTFKYGLGKLVECGECGAFIPAASKRCPKCGVEFEAGTMKCSECGAWVPAEATECSNCGVKFVGEEKISEEDYLERMKAEYEEMVSKYRELAKPELGKKFSEKKFEEWWKGQPTYVSFEDWLAKEEEKRKEGPVPCPVCGTLNPKEATVCHKCGTVFGKRDEPLEREPGTPPEEPPMMPLTQDEGAPESMPSPDEEGPKPAAPKMVIRRPIDRKVVPKKIIRAPVQQQARSENDQSENGE
jgi:subtilase family serine protease/ribosomal protein L40E